MSDPAAQSSVEKSTNDVKALSDLFPLDKPAKAKKLAKAEVLEENSERTLPKNKKSKTKKKLSKMDKKKKTKTTAELSPSEEASEKEMDLTSANKLASSI